MDRYSNCHSSQAGQSSDNQKYGSQGSGRGRGGGHPSHLKGKAIGLYYRDKGLKKRAEQAMLEDKFPGFSLDDSVVEEVNRILGQIAPLTSTVKTSSAFGLDDGLGAKYDHVKDSQFKRNFLEIVTGNIDEKLSKSMLVGSRLAKNSFLDGELSVEHQKRQNRRAYKEMMNFRVKLPAWEKKNEILELVKHHQVVVISGETGCGKTTQVAQFILDDAIESGNGSTVKIVCTQPRRISAISVAERVAAERDEYLGSSVAYHIRLEKTPSREYGSILFCTTGLLLKQMQGDPALRSFSHIILDEIHERNTESDFIITLLKQVIPKRPDLKIILMSATLNSEQFSSYYNKCPNLHIPGFTYPVEDFYLEDVLKLTRYRFSDAGLTSNRYSRPELNQKMNQMLAEFSNNIRPAIDLLEEEEKYPRYVTRELKNPRSEMLDLGLIVALLQYICTNKGPGAVLIFIPGMMDITKLTQLIHESGEFSPMNYAIYPLHSRMPTVEQKLIFMPPPTGVRKIIIATSIAETSITIEDVVYVIETGRTKLSRFDTAKNLETLEAEWVSLANAKQRRGRAGRVQKGECYHLYTRARESILDQYPTPEMLRTPLDQVILQVKILQLGKVEEFLANVMDPPAPRAISLSLELLRTLDALDADEQLTPLGYHLANLPLDPRTGKMIIWAALFSCIDPVFSIAASLAFKDAFYCPLGKEKEANSKKLELGLGQHSDHIALAEALKRFERAHASGYAKSFCFDYFLSFSTLKLLADMKQQFARYLCEMKFLTSEIVLDDSANRNSGNLNLVKAIVCAGLYPNVATVEVFGSKRPAKVRTAEDGKVAIHPGSINADATYMPTPYLTYFLKQRSSAIYLHDTTSVSWVALLFAAPKCLIQPRDQFCEIVLNELIKIRCQKDTAALIQRLRQELDALFEYKITHPGSIQPYSREGHVLQAVAEVVTDGYKPAPQKLWINPKPSARMNRRR